MVNYNCISWTFSNATMAKYGVTVCLIIIFSAISCLAQMKKPDLGRSKSMEQIVSRGSSQRAVPPNYNIDDTPVHVKVLLYVASIDAVNEANMDFTVSILLHMRWNDSRLVTSTGFNPFDSYPHLDVDSDNIKQLWTPDVFFPNEKNGQFHNLIQMNRMMRLFNNGGVLYISRLSLTLSCPMDLKNYPFDVQTCYMLIMSFGYSKQDLVFEWVNSTEDIIGMDEEKFPIYLDDNVKLPQFVVDDYYAQTCDMRYHQKVGKHSCLQANFVMTRSVGFYIVQMYIPSALVVMLSWISFWLTVNSVPGRISLGLLTVLTMTTQSSSVNAALPRVSYTKAIDVWMLTCLVFVFAALLEFAIVQVLSRHDSEHGVVSLKHIFKVAKNSAGEDSSNEITVPLDGYSKENRTPKKARSPRGLVIATYLDLFSRLFFPTLFFLFILCYWQYYANSSGSNLEDIGASDVKQNISADVPGAKLEDMATTTTPANDFPLGDNITKV